MTIDFYYNPVSSPCRTVLLAGKAIGVEFNLIELNLLKDEHLTPEFTKLNPQHTIPTINDNGLVLWESRAIITYLQDKYGKNDTLYPRDPRKRAVVDHRLYFDMDFYSRLSQAYSHKTILTGAAPDPEKLEQAKKSIEFLNAFLEKSEYAAGDNLTLADLPLAVNISNLSIFDYDLTPYKNIRRWFDKVKATAPGYKEANEDNLKLMKELLKKLAASHQQ